MSVEELVSQIRSASQAYYAGKAFISDKEFDQLTDKLRAIDPAHPVLGVIGWGGEQTGKIEHKYGVVGSLEKEKDWNALISNFNSSSIVTPKLDGSSVTIYYEKGELQYILTRGDGTLATMKPQLKVLVPSKIGYTMGDVAIRGEIVMRKSVFEKKYKHLGFMSPRNLATGLMHRKELSPDEKQDVEILVYKIHGKDGKAITNSKFEMLGLLKGWGFKVPEFRKLSPDVEVFQDWITEMDYPTDGIVVTRVVCDIEENGLYKYDEIAFKFEEDDAVGFVDHIEWKFTDRNKFVPVVKLKSPIILDGARISSIKADNAQFIKDKQLGHGSFVKIIRVNEVIPYLKEVVAGSQADLPEDCPVCKSKLVWAGKDLMCENSLCPHLSERQLMAYLLDFLDRNVMEIQGVGEGLLKSIIKALDIKDMKDMIEKLQLLNYDQIRSQMLKYPGIGNAKVNLVMAFVALLRRKPPTKSKVLSIMVVGLGQKGADLILMSNPDLDDDKMDKVMDLPRVSKKVKEFIRLNRKYLVDIFRTMSNLNSL